MSVNDKPTIMGLEASDNLAFERDFRAQAEQHAINAEARASLAEERLDVVLGELDEMRTEVAYWEHRAKEAERRSESLFAIVIGVAIVLVGLGFAFVVVKAWRGA